MNVILWLQQPNFQLINAALGTLAQTYGMINFVGVYSAGGLKNGFVINGKPMPLLDQNSLKTIPCDLIVFSGQNFAAACNEAQSIGLNPEKIIPDNVIIMYGFSLERYAKLRRSQLSIISRGNFGGMIQHRFGLQAQSIGINTSDRDFLRFLQNPLQYVSAELRDKINWLNILVVMWTEDPKVLEEFDRLPIGKKICFVPFETEVESAFYIKPYYVGGREFILAVNNVASGNVICFDIWDALLYCRKTPVNLQRNDGTEKAMPSKITCVTSDRQIHYFNCCNKGNADEFWFTRFIRNEVSKDKTFNFFNQYGDHRFVRGAPVERKILTALEEIFTWPWYDGYQDYCLSEVQLAMGNEYLKKPKYMRFSYLIPKIAEPKLDMKSIEKKISEINAARNTKKYECVIITSHDMMNTRTAIYNQLKSEVEIKSAGKWNRNTDELQTDYGNDKIKYVHEFMFNICPENVSRVGYVTEKIFDAFIAGSIPIYYGSDNKPEPGVINPDAVLFFDPKSDNEELVREVRRLKSDEAYYDKFMRQEKLFAKPAAEFIYSTLEELAKRLREMK